MNHQQALRAIKARINGEWDQPDLVAHGALGTAREDILAIIEKVQPLSLPDLTEEENAAIRQATLSPVFQNLIGCEEWDLSEDAENDLWSAIKKLENDA